MTLSGSVADDLRLFLAFFQHARTKAAHGHDAYFVPKHLRRTLDFQFLL